MKLEEKLLNTETDEIMTVKEVIEIIREIRGKISIENALNEIEYSLKHGILKRI